MGDEIFHSFASHGCMGGTALSDSQKAEDLAECLEAVSAGKRTVGTGIC
jgi:hypothetical protein